MLAVLLSSYLNAKKDVGLSVGPASGVLLPSLLLSFTLHTNCEIRLHMHNLSSSQVLKAALNASKS